jgi:hypothetical protein
MKTVRVKKNLLEYNAEIDGVEVYYTIEESGGKLKSFISVDGPGGEEESKLLFKQNIFNEDDLKWVEFVFVSYEKESPGENEERLYFDLKKAGEKIGTLCIHTNSEGIIVDMFDKDGDEHLGSHSLDIFGVWGEEDDEKTEPFLPPQFEEDADFEIERAILGWDPFERVRMCNTMRCNKDISLLDVVNLGYKKWEKLKHEDPDKDWYHEQWYQMALEDLIMGLGPNGQEMEVEIDNQNSYPRTPSSSM